MLEPRPQAPGATPAQEFQYQAADPGAAYCFPPLTMLAQSPQVDHAKETEELQANGKILVDTLNSFGVSTKILDICRGPAVTRYEIQPAAGVKVSKITNLSDDLALNLAATGVRIEAPIPGKAAVGGRPGPDAPYLNRRHHGFRQVGVRQLLHRQHALQGKPR